MLLQLDKQPETFRAISREYGGCLQLVGYFHVEYPGLRFEKEIVEYLAKFGLSVDFDFYYLYSDDREDT